MPMNPEVKAQWLADLRSGEYRQGTGQLELDGKFCCLGVLCEQAVKAGIIAKTGTSEDGSRYDGQDSYPSYRVADWAGLSEKNPHMRITGHSLEFTLGELNDNGPDGDKPYSFAQIADLIEDQL